MTHTESQPHIVQCSLTTEKQGKRMDRNAIIIKYCKSRDPVLKERIVVSYSSLVEYIANKLAFNKEDLDDLIQVGNIGLLKSLERYKPSREIDFSTFATPNIIGEIKHYFRDKSRLVKIPRKTQELYSRIRTYIREFSKEDGRSPTVTDIAIALEVSEEEVLESLEAGQVSHVLSLDAPLYRSDRGSDGNSLLDNLGIEAREDFLLDKESVKQALDKLDPREKKIILYRFFDGLTQMEIAEKLNLSQMHISRLLTQALHKIKKHLEATPRRSQK